MTTQQTIDGVFRPSEVLLIVPPFADLVQASLACHLLQAIAKQRGFDVQVVYANIVLASIMGESLYREGVTRGNPSLILERYFGTVNYGMDPLTEEEEALVEPEGLKEMPSFIAVWRERMRAIIAAVGPKVVGSTSSYEQISPSIALLNLCKEIDENIVTIMGGANCEDQMAEGILSLGCHIDHIFSGESEETFPAFLDQILRQGEQPPQIIQGSPCQNMEVLPLPEYGEFFAQYDHFLPKSGLRAYKLLGVPYETSRGCWWGQKHHCTFCGLNGGGMGFRKKSPEKAFYEIKTLADTYPVNKINIVDNIMPFNYFNDLLPKMAEELPEHLELFYEQKANLTLKKVDALKRGRVVRIQPGIEALNSELLTLMDKGVKAYQNVALLRYSRAAGMSVSWNLLCAFPGDRRESYEETQRLIPLITHLQPPDGPGPLRIDRFSPYFVNPEKYGITNLRPMQPYHFAFPASADLHKLAYHFDGDYQCAFRDDMQLAKTIARETVKWQESWEKKGAVRPKLKVIRLFDGNFVLHDTRGLPGTRDYTFLSKEQVHQILTGGTLADRPALEWAIQAKLVVELDGRLIPLAIAPMDLLLEIEETAAGAVEMQERLAV